MEIYVVQESHFLRYDDGTSIRQDLHSYYSYHSLAITHCGYRKKEIEMMDKPRYLETIWLEILRCELDRPEIKPKGLYWWSKSFKDKRKKK